MHSPHRPPFSFTWILAFAPVAFAFASDCPSPEDSAEVRGVRAAAESALKSSNDAANSVVFVLPGKTPIVRTVLLTPGKKSLEVLSVFAGKNPVYAIDSREKGNAYLIPFAETEMKTRFFAGKQCPPALRENRALRGECSVLDFSKLAASATILYGEAGNQCDVVANLHGHEPELSTEDRGALLKAKEFLASLFGNAKGIGQNREPGLPPSAQVEKGDLEKRQAIDTPRDNTRSNSGDTQSTRGN